MKLPSLFDIKSYDKKYVVFDTINVATNELPFVLTRDTGFSYSWVESEYIQIQQTLDEKISADFHATTSAVFEALNFPCLAALQATKREYLCALETYFAETCKEEILSFSFDAFKAKMKRATVNSRFSHFQENHVILPEIGRIGDLNLISEGAVVRLAGSSANNGYYQVVSLHAQAAVLRDFSLLATTDSDQGAASIEHYNTRYVDRVFVDSATANSLFVREFLDYDPKVNLQANSPFSPTAVDTNGDEITTVDVFISLVDAPTKISPVLLEMAIFDAYLRDDSGGFSGEITEERIDNYSYKTKVSSINFDAFGLYYPANILQKLKPFQKKEYLL